MDDLVWAHERVREVSRTFAIGIAALPQPWKTQVTASYLLCRVADTVEDSPVLRWDQRRELFSRLDHALDTDDAAPFVDAARVLPPDPEGELARGLPRLLALCGTFPEDVRASIRRWVAEMAQGMAVYARREAFSALRDESDLGRYCYFVAGTVGHLLTDLFAAGSPRIAARADLLRERAEGFGRLLQLTNIATDIAEDHARGRCYVPQTLCAAWGLRAEDLLDPDHAGAAVAAIGDLVHLAWANVDDAVEYVLAIPHQDVAVRRFCLLPLLLALGTLRRVEGNPAVLSARVKLEGLVVQALVEVADRLAEDDDALVRIHVR